MGLKEEVAEISKKRAALVDDGENDPRLDSSNDESIDDWSDPGSGESPEKFFNPRKLDEGDIELKKLPDDKDEGDDDDGFDYEEDDFFDGDDSEKVENKETKTAETEGDGKKTDSDAKIPESKDSGKTALVDDETLAKAINLGLKPDDIKGYAELGNLSSVIGILEKSKNGEAAKDEKKEEQAQDEFNIELEFDEDIFDPEFVQGINDQVNKKVAPVLKQLNDRINQLQSGRTEDSRVAVEREFDAVISSLDDSYVEVLGKDPGRKLDPNCEQMQNRAKILQTVTELARKQTTNNWTMKELVDQALPMVFPEHQKTAAAKEIQATLNKRSNNFINKPTTRQQQLSPKSKAVSAVAAKMSQYGLNPNGENLGEEDEY